MRRRSPLFPLAATLSLAASLQVATSVLVAASLTVAAVLVVAGGAASCVSESKPKVTGRATQGVILGAPLETVWAAVQAALPNARPGGVARSAVADVRGVAVEAFVERYDDTRTILHVNSSDPARANEVQMAVQRSLLR
jgi:hypothetical protein